MFSHRALVSNNGKASTPDSNTFYTTHMESFKRQDDEEQASSGFSESPLDNRNDEFDDLAITLLKMDDSEKTNSLDLSSLFYMSFDDEEEDYEQQKLTNDPFLNNSTETLCAVLDKPDEFLLSDCMQCNNVQFNLSDDALDDSSSESSSELLNSAITDMSKPLQPPNRSRSCLIDYKSNKRSSLARVTFADAMGYALENIRYLTPPNDFIPPIMQMESINDKVETLFRHTRPRKILMPTFEQPNSLHDFSDRVKCNSVMLEYAFSNCLSIYGSIRVCNFEYEKNIIVRYTIDDWVSSRELKTNYSHHHNDSNTDSFTFYYNFSSWLANLKKVQFAIRYKMSNGTERWDNNNQKNYTLVCKYV